MVKGKGKEKEETPKSSGFAMASLCDIKDITGWILSNE
jgi:hypothetical protein